MSTTGTVDGIAREAAAWFERATRTDGETYIRLRDGAPDWILDAVRAAHRASGYLYLPNDWIYATARAAFEAIADAGDDDDAGHDFSDNVDLYSSDLAAWLDDYPGARAAIDEAVAELGAPEPASDIDRLIQLGQYVARGQIYGAVLGAVRERSESE